MCCELISKINALAYYGKDIQEYIEQWDFLVDMAACRNGSVIFHKKIMDHLGLREIRIPRRDIPKHIPVEISFHTPPPKHSSIGFFHSALVIGIKDDLWTIVNYRGGNCKLITVVLKEKIRFVYDEDSINDRHHHLLLK